MSDFKSKPLSSSILILALMLSVSVVTTPAYAEDTDGDGEKPALSAAENALRLKSGAAAQANVAKPKRDPALDAGLPKPGANYYDDRAKKMVGGEQKSKMRGHPLQEKYSDQNVVVCEAGCPSGKTDQITFIEPKSARKPRSSAQMVQTAAAGAAKNLEVMCEAGCYGATPKTYHGVPGPALNAALKGLAASSAPAGSWVTTITSADAKPAAAPKAGSGDWMKRIEQANEPKPVVSAAPQKVEDKPTETAAKAVEKAPSAPAPQPTVAAAASAKETDQAKPADATATEESPQKDLQAADKPAEQPTDAKATAVETPNVPKAAAMEKSAPVVESQAADVAEVQPAKEPAAETKAAETVKPNSDPAADAKAAAVGEVKDTDPTKASDASEDAAQADGASTKNESAANADAANEGSDLKSASDMAAALDKAKATADKAAAISAEKLATSTEASPAGTAGDMAAASSPEKPSIISGAETPAPSSSADAQPSVSGDKPMQVAALDAAEQPATPAPVTSSGETAINVNNTDAEMNAAVQKARDTLPDFWSKLETPKDGEADFSLKVEVADEANGQIEHFWLTDIVRKDGKIVGIISNEPQTVKTVARGQSYEINPEKISDWLYKRNGKVVGNETMRVLLKTLPAEQAASYRDMYETP
jgi:uncharacterized protein YegJ (DUF2314 family)